MLFSICSACRCKFLIFRNSKPRIFLLVHWFIPNSELTIFPDFVNFPKIQGATSAPRAWSALPACRFRSLSVLLSLTSTRTLRSKLLLGKNYKLQIANILVPAGPDSPSSNECLPPPSTRWAGFEHCLVLTANKLVAVATKAPTTYWDTGRPG